MKIVIILRLSRLDFCGGIVFSNQSRVDAGTVSIVAPTFGWGKIM